MEIRAITLKDKPAWLTLRKRLLPAMSDRQHDRDWNQMMEQRGQRMTLVSIGDDGALLGMLEVSRQPGTRPFDSGAVGYVHTFYVEPGEQREEAARRLAEAAARWAQTRGCRSLAADTSLDNQWEQKLHLDLGFEEVARKVVYRKVLSAAADADTLSGSDLQMPRPATMTNPPPQQTPQVEVSDEAPFWWPGPARALIIFLGVLSLYYTDVFSNDILLGVVLPIVDVVFLIYLMVLFVSMKYRRRTDAGERHMELFQASNDGE